MSLSGLEYAVHPTLTLRIDHFELYPGQLHVLLGANGAGKSTLLKLMSGQVAPDRGTVELLSRDIRTLTSKEQAQRRAVLAQEHSSVFSFTAQEIVAMGRYPWAGTPEQHRDRVMVNNAIIEFELKTFSTRPLDVLSGGEKARVAMARITAQHTPVILLDEPTAALDLKHQISLMKSVKDFTAAGGSALMIVHDINRALEFADRVSFLHEGHIISSGTPQDVVTAETIEKTYGVQVDVRPHPLTRRLHVTPLV